MTKTSTIINTNNPDQQMWIVGSLSIQESGQMCLQATEKIVFLPAKHWIQSTWELDLKNS
jgi:hypothetical protein